MKICVIGTGYVGLVAGTCFADMGHDVICVDKDEEKIQKLRQGIIPIYEPGLEELIINNVNEERLAFSTDLDAAVKSSLVCIIAVGTPQDDNGSADLTSVWQVAKQIGESINGYKVVVDKSTVPVGTADKVRQIISEVTNFEFDVISNPEFLKQGAAVDDFLRPDRVIIGSNSERATKIMQEIYLPFVKTGNPVLIMDVKSAEMSKYAANSFLALKISYINEIANICEAVGADIEMVRKGLCTDSRIGSKALYPGLGYGGSCFPKDVKALIKTAQENGYDAQIIKAADDVNKKQRELFINKITKKFGTDLSDKVFAVWGLSFKPKTNDLRESPSITVINRLLAMGAKIQAFDPKAFDTARLIFKDSITYSETAYEALNGADALLLITEWNEFKHPNLQKIKESMKTPIIIDGRNQYNKKQLNLQNIEYICIGKV
jgi:UDPglucose 6-dehydrogenase